MHTPRGYRKEGMESTVTSCCDDAEGHAVPGHTHGYGEQKEAYLKRLRRIEGQIRGCLLYTSPSPRDRG